MLMETDLLMLLVPASRTSQPFLAGGAASQISKWDEHHLLVMSWVMGQCTLSKSGEDTKLEGVVGAPGGAVQKDLSRLEKGALRNLMSSSRRSAKAFIWGGTTPDTRTCCWKTAWQEKPGGPGGRQIEHEPAACPCHKDGSLPQER